MSAGRRHVALICALVVLAALLAGCGAGSQSLSSDHAGVLRVVAAENFWGSVAAQLGGDRVHLDSIVVNPSTDPHSYEPTPADGREIAEAQMAIVNGIGYDEWASKLLAAEPASGRAVLDVGDLLSLHAGDNPHQWYSPVSVRRVIDAIVASYERLDPGARSYFLAREHAFEDAGLARYDALIAEIRRRYASVPIGYSESIFQPLGEALHLKLLTPSSFAKAVAEGAEVSAQDREAVDAQAQDRAIAVWVFNSQNVTPDVKRVSEIATAKHIPIVTVTETLDPASASFQQWQVAELERLIAAFHTATGR